MSSVTSPENAVTGFVPATYVRLLFEYLEQRGIDPVALLGERQPDEREPAGYPVARWGTNLIRASEYLDDPLLGLHLGQTIAPHHFGVIGYVLLACSHLGAALDRMQRYQRLIYDVNPLQLKQQGGKVTLAWGVARGRPGRLVDECAITALVQFARDLSGQPSLAPNVVAFVNPPPEDTSPYEAWFGCPAAFAARQTRVVFDPALFALPLRRADPGLVAVLENQAEAMLAVMPDEAEIRIEVRRVIAQQLSKGEPRLETVAKNLHLSTRTLHRRLAAQHCKFRDLLAETRHDMAERYLADPGLQLSEIALLLGYSEQSAFTRAFRQWTGLTPKAFRAGGRRG